MQLVLFFIPNNVLAEEGSIKVTATIAHYADYLSNILPKNFSIKSLIGTGVDPHLYKMSKNDLKQLLDSDLIIFNGLHLEGRMVEVSDKLKDSGKRVIKVGESIDQKELISKSDQTLAYDPHIWMDPILFKQSLLVLSEKIIEIYPEHKEQILLNQKKYFSDYDTRLNGLFNKLSSIPENNRYLITAHDAFGYFGKRFKFNVIGVQGISTESEAGISRIREIIDIIIKNNIKTIFAETSVSDKSLKAIIEGAAARGYQVRIGETLYSDSLGPVNSTAHSYIGMIEHNFNSIIQGLSSNE